MKTETTISVSSNRWFASWMRNQRSRRERSNGAAERSARRSRRAFASARGASSLCRQPLSPHRGDVRQGFFIDHEASVTGQPLIDMAVQQYGCQDVWALVSGGTDSLTALSVALEHPSFRGVLHLNTGVGVEQSREHVRQVCKDVGCPLAEYCAKDNVNAKGTPDPQVYEDIVLEHGFPGPTKSGHGIMYARLKQRSIERFCRDHAYRHQNKVIFITGVRSAESRRRMGFVKPINLNPSADKRYAWVAPIHDWSKGRCVEHLESRPHGIRINPISLLLNKSGECY